MKFGVCIPVESAAPFAAAGWDFVEEIVPNLVKWPTLEAARKCPLPLPAANRLVPGELKIVGPNADPLKLEKYLTGVVERAAAVGMRILVFGSGPARSVPDGFDRERARQQIVDFCKMAAPICAGRNITLVAEPLNRGESNIINSVTEAMTYVRAVDHPAFQCLVDTYHLWLENEPIEDVERVLPSIRHVHVSDVEGRRAPGETGKQDYRPLFAMLRRGNYDGLITVESNDLHTFHDGAIRILAYLKQQWQEAAAF
jgi:sugar phosphate isomerase/epimerase